VAFDLKAKKAQARASRRGFRQRSRGRRKTLYVSDNRNDKLVKVKAADFLNAKKEPAVTEVFPGKSVNPNGLYRRATARSTWSASLAPTSRARSSRSA
jgi:hypothetical protein